MLISGLSSTLKKTETLATPEYFDLEKRGKAPSLFRHHCLDAVHPVITPLEHEHAQLALGNVTNLCNLEEGRIYGHCKPFDIRYWPKRYWPCGP